MPAGPTFPYEATYVYAGDNPSNSIDPTGLVPGEVGGGAWDAAGGTYDAAAVEAENLRIQARNESYLDNEASRTPRTTRARMRTAKAVARVGRSTSPTAQGTGNGGRWFEYKTPEGRRVILVQHPDGSIHIGTPKPQSTHLSGGPPKFYDNIFGFPLGHIR